MKSGYMRLQSLCQSRTLTHQFVLFRMKMIIFQVNNISSHLQHFVFVTHFVLPSLYHKCLIPKFYYSIVLVKLMGFESQSDDDM